ncbi:MAG: LemA family protein [archaeon]
MDLIFWVILGVVAVIVLAFILIYNSLIVLRNRIENAWAQIDVQTKKRYDLIPNLVETVKGYAKHEKAVFNEVTKARSAVAQAKDIGAKAKAENMLSGALKTLFAIAENYPQLRASENFMQLQEELSGIESKIAYARQFYNDSVLQYNQSIQTFPTNLVAGMFGFKEKPYFEAEEAARKAVKISF